MGVTIRLGDLNIRNQEDLEKAESIVAELKKELAETDDEDRAHDLEYWIEEMEFYIQEALDRWNPPGDPRRPW